MSPENPVILLVDDDEDILAAHTRILREHFPQARVVQANTASEALKTIARHVVDLVVSDYSMPEMDGIQMLAQARRLNPRIGRVIFTSFAEPTVGARAAAEGIADDFISKDLPPDAFARRLRAVLDRRRRRAVDKAMAQRLDQAGFGPGPVPRADPDDVS